MFCEHCGTKIDKDTKFCHSCGKSVSMVSTSTSSKQDGGNEIKPLQTIIKCGNCAYIGPAEPARSIAGMILAWLCVLFAPIVTIIYFAATHKYRCPKCKSTFIGVKDKEGNFVGQKSGAWRFVVIILSILAGVAIIGILSAIVLASLNVARTKAADAQIMGSISSARATAEIYYSKNSESYSLASGCDSGMFGSSDFSGLISNLREKTPDLSCYADGDSYAISSSLTVSTGGSWCADSTGYAGTGVATENGSAASCDRSKGLSNSSVSSDSSDSMTNEEYIKQVVIAAKKVVTLPKIVDDSTTLTDIIAEPSSLRYQFALHGLDLSSYTNSIFSQKMKPILTTDVCKNDTLVGMMNRGIDIDYSYLDKETYKSFLVTFTKGDCL